LAQVLDAHSAVGRRVRFEQIVESLREVMMRELNYCDEAESCRTLKCNLREFELFYIPAVIDDYCSRRVLTSEFVEAAKFTTVSPVVLVELDRPAYADELFRVYLHQVLIDGLFHSDPHPGNLMLTIDRKIALIDFGMVSRVTTEMQRHLVKLLMALGDGRAEEAAEEAMGLGRPYRRNRFNEDEFRERVAVVVAANQDRPVEEMQFGRTVMEINAAAAESGLKLPSAVLMLGKTLMNLDKVVTVIDPHFNPQEAMRRHAAEIFRRHGRSRWSPGLLYRTMLDGVDFIERLPERMNKLADLAAHNKLKITVDAIDENRLIAGLQKIANRITTGLILAAMIVGASVMMRLQVQPTLFGYPVIALVFFLGAAAASIVLLWRIAFRDEPPF
jgi:predicted unusual protein kinase regulating ubiquinone biosynthesis (AarF/ABC1/UbiB family)